jgi:peroxiredoxin
MKPDTKVPDLDLPLTNGGRYKLSEQSPENFTLLVFYRGKHCPICRNQLKDLADRIAAFTENGVGVVAISMDSEERAQHIHENWETGNVPLAYALSEDDARKWGLYISGKRPDSDEPDVFSEPGLFLVRPDMSLYFASTQNAPFTRPPLDELLQGIKYVVGNDYPTRGTMT